MANILLVDDDTLVRQCLRDVLSPLGHRLLEARDGAEALELISQTPPDLVLLDLLMPNKSGMDVLREVRRRWAQLPVVVISSMEAQGLVAEALMAGARGFIPKPFRNQEVSRAVGKVLAN